MAAAVLIAVAVRVLSTSAGYVRGAAWTLLVFVPIQIFLGAFSIWSRRAVPVTVAHVGTGAVLLAATVWLTLRLYEARAAEESSLSLLRPAAAAGGLR